MPAAIEYNYDVTHADCLLFICKTHNADLWGLGLFARAETQMDYGAARELHNEHPTNSLKYSTQTSKYTGSCYLPLTRILLLFRRDATIVNCTIGLVLYFHSHYSPILDIVGFQFDSKLTFKNH